MLHVTNAYCVITNDDQRGNIIEYAPTLGDAPIIIGANWHEEAERSLAVKQSLMTREWAEPMQHIAQAGHERAQAQLGTATTHRANTTSKCIDNCLVNRYAAPYMYEAPITGEAPLTNHYAIQLVLG